MAVQRVRLVVAIGILVGALVNDGRAVQFADCLVTLAGKRLAHECAPRRAHSGHFAAMFEFVAFTDGRFHILATEISMDFLGLLSLI